MTLGLIEFDGGTDYIRLTDQGKDFYYGDDAHAFGKSYKCKDIYAFIEKLMGISMKRKSMTVMLLYLVVNVSCIE